jgi:hypothetical protein
LDTRRGRGPQKGGGAIAGAVDPRFANRLKLQGRVRAQQAVVDRDYYNAGQQARIRLMNAQAALTEARPALLAGQQAQRTAAEEGDNPGVGKALRPWRGRGRQREAGQLEELIGRVVTLDLPSFKWRLG